MWQLGFVAFLYIQAVFQKKKNQKPKDSLLSDMETWEI